MTVEIGKKAPAFKYFYPRDSTPGCTTEGQNFRDSISKFKRQNCVILRVV